MTGWAAETLHRAAGPDSGPGDFSSPITWINYGVLGLIFIGWATGWLHSKNEVQRLEAEIDRLRYPPDPGGRMTEEAAS